MRKIILIILTLILVGFDKEEIQFSAKVDKNKINLEEVITLTIALSGEFKEVPEIKAPNLEDFQVIARRSESSFNLGEEVIKTKHELIYVLAAKSAGKFSIGVAEVTYKAKTYKTEPLEIEVSPAKAAPIEKPESPQKKIPQTEEGMTL
jgi:hypothetical protein